ncbi:MAG: hypothetical protein HZA01_02700 [Nitrospinae bacterium]|nr:hypothetical protein [Nitrospinota bacterium]
MNYHGYTLIIHIASASAFAMAMIIMQLVVANVMKRIPDSPGKKDASLFIQKKWHPVVDGIIIAVGASAAVLAASSWGVIQSSPILSAKAAFGSAALCSAYANHFVFRYWKRGLSASGKNPGLLKKLGKTTAVLDKTALVCGVITVCLGWHWGHG